MLSALWILETQLLKPLYRATLLNTIKQSVKQTESYLDSKELNDVVEELSRTSHLSFRIIRMEGNSWTNISSRYDMFDDFLDMLNPNEINRYLRLSEETGEYYSYNERPEEEIRFPGAFPFGRNSINNDYLCQTDPEGIRILSYPFLQQSHTGGNRDIHSESRTHHRFLPVCRTQSDLYVSFSQKS